MKLKRIALIPLFMLMIIVLTGCKYEYEFEQDLENVESVEIRRCHYEKYKLTETTHIITLDDDSAAAMLEDFSATDCYEVFGDFELDYGYIIVYINYKNGEAEIIGTELSGKVDVEGNLQVKIRCFSKSDFCNIVLKYVDEDLVPELVSEYPEITSKP